ncbi:hypothetical protein [Spirosoma telluris]
MQTLLVDHYPYAECLHILQDNGSGHPVKYPSGGLFLRALRRANRSPVE